MASGVDVQLEAGNWSRIHNLILEQLAKANLNGRESKCLFFLLRMTYGNQCKEHEISLSLWAEGTAIDKRHVKPVVDNLVKRAIVYRMDGKRGRGNTAIYGFNKYFEEWDKAEEKVPSTVPIKKVLDSVPFLESDSEEKVPSTVPEKVPSTVPIKERRREAAAATKPSQPPRITSEFVKAYERVWGLTVASEYIGEQIQEWERRVTLEGWTYALQESVDNRNAGKWRYLTRILERVEREGYQSKQVASTLPSILDISIEAYT